ncbi:hypothetical protein EZ428_07010 [Pedobacter frigiditerrae]|uniref:Peptidase MA superfamily protein n=1 Tax=Pedobacter frigiditerrae TaxID=2530452 RepID=A0A4R0N8G2_9SPHI|nr:hypothetical protein [Pedobacter frigiditerrae]TCC94514.1 hypothetical protein EZ428_07010 [Pedobacter frigiditerrae]
MKQALIFVIVIHIVFVCKGYGQKSDSTLIISKPAFYLIPDTSVRVELTNSLKGFLKARNDVANPNPYIDSTYLKESVEPFYWLSNAEAKKPNGKNFFTPTLLTVMPIGGQKYIMKLAYMAVSKSDSNIPELNLIASFEARKIGDKYLFYNTIDYNTRLYNVKQVGNIKYIYPNKLDDKKAKKMNDFNTSFAKKFNVEPLKITYYKCDDPEQLFKMLGFDYIENMYFSLSGGLAYPWANTLLAGNNSELYEHETVHFYTSTLFEHKTREVDEGYATYIGGSGGVNLDGLSVFAKNYINSNKTSDICELATNFKVRIEGGVPITYILSGLVCRDIEERFGVDGIKKLFTPEPQEDYFATLKRINGIGKEEFPIYIKGLLAKY